MGVLERHARIGSRPGRRGTRIATLVGVNHQRVHLLFVEEALHRVGKLDLVSGTRRLRCQQVHDAGREKVATNDEEVGGGVLGLWLLDETSHLPDGSLVLLAAARTVEAANALAISSGAVVSMSGPVDYITDGTTVLTIANGHPLMSRITAMGCTASVITGAFIAAGEDSLMAARNAMALMGIAGERAAERASGTGSMEMHFIDELSTFEPSDYARSIRI